jgi:hypothetical protein
MYINIFIYAFILAAHFWIGVPSLPFSTVTVSISASDSTNPASSPASEELYCTHRLRIQLGSWVRDSQSLGTSMSQWLKNGNSFTAVTWLHVSSMHKNVNISVCTWHYRYLSVLVNIYENICRNNIIKFRQQWTKEDIKQLCFMFNLRTTGKMLGRYVSEWQDCCAPYRIWICRDPQVTTLLSEVHDHDSHRIRCEGGACFWATIHITYEQILYEQNTIFGGFFECRTGTTPM